jgi:sec-independent protein translocase protein TatA
MFSLIFGLGGQELLVIGLIILVFFGGKKIPELMRGLGSGIREFNNAKNNIEAEVKENMKEIDSKKQGEFITRE